MTSQPGQQTVTKYILPNISQNKGKADYEIWSINRM